MKLSSETIRQLIRPAFPQATAISHRLLEGSAPHLEFILQLENPTTQIALRLYRPDTPPHVLEKEMYVLRVAMSETGVPTPRVIHFDDSQALIDRPYALFDLLPGEPLEKALPRMDELDQESVGYEAGRYLAKLHSIPLEKFGEFLGQDPQASLNEKAYTLARLTRWLEVCEENALLDESIIVRVRRRAGQIRLLNRESACFVHGNYFEGNIKVEEGTAGFHVTGIYGFERAQGWSPEWDMGRLLARVSDRHPALVKGFLDGYADTSSLPEDFWERLRLYQWVMLISDVAQAHLTGDEPALKRQQAQLNRFLEKEF